LSPRTEASPQPLPAAALTLHDVACERGGRLLFDGLSLSLQPGQMLRVRGANGAGKSSLLRVLCGLQPAARGSVLWRGRPIAAQRESFAQSLAYLGHALALSDELSAEENLHAASALAGEAAPGERVRAALRDAGLGGHERRPIKRLSQGQRRRCALARLALADRRALWVLDEPFTALDADATTWVDTLLRRHLQRGGLLVLTSHQDLSLDAEPHLAVDL